MNMVNLLVTTPIGEELLRQITATSPQIKLTDVSELVSAEQRGDYSRKEEFDALLAEAEIVLGFSCPENLTARAPRLKWVQAMSAGVDRFLDNEFQKSSIILTNEGGIRDTPISEIVLEMMLMFVKRAPFCFELKQKRQWKQFMPTILRSKTVGIIGVGNIGREVARLAKAFGMRVIATRRSTNRVSRARYVDVLLPREQLPLLLSDSDFVVLSLPLTAETNKLIGENELRAMKPTAYIINIARGKIIDEEALIRALEENWIAGAGLDVFATEPLPADSKLWEFPNIIFSPHIAGGQDRYYALSTEFFCENLRRYLNNQRLLNVVNKRNGY